MIESLISFIRDIYQSDGDIPLHSPSFKGNEKKYLLNAVNTTFVSSIGAYVDMFEQHLCAFTGAKKAIATINGTCALHASLHCAGVKRGDHVITQSLTFFGTCSALLTLGAVPIFVDVDRCSMGLSPDALEEWLHANADIDSSGICRLTVNRKRVAAVIPMHTFGHAVRLEELEKICKVWGLTLIEDAAESIGSYYKGKHLGTFGHFGVLSFNGNKTITTGGGGAVLCSDLLEGQRLKHVTTTAKVSHEFEFVHDELGFNYRLPNLNAAVGCAQMESLDSKLKDKRFLAEEYEKFFSNTPFVFFKEPSYARSNYWLNTVICESKQTRNRVLEQTNAVGIKTRPIWRPMHKLEIFSDSIHGPMENTDFFADRAVNLPSSPFSASK